MFVDRARIEAQAGRGGDGTISFARASGAPHGGPDGGDGGDGGSVILVATKRRPTLADIARRPLYRAEDGTRGTGRNRAGGNGDDLVIEVPLGTIVRDAVTNEEITDLVGENTRYFLARGGRGGFGNVHFATATNQVPRVAERGEPGQRKAYMLELKLLAQIGLVGLPNAGKSTFLRRVSRARPKVGAYPFTTLTPHLGVAVLPDGRELVIADLPGLIEGAHKGVGLGDEFLRHVERCRVILHLVDGTGGPEQGTLSPSEAYRVIRGELVAYDAKLGTKPEIVALNKCDALDAAAADKIAHDLEEATGRPVRRISGVAGTGIDPLLVELAAMVAEIEASEAPLIPPERRIPPHLVYDLEPVAGEVDEQGPPFEGPPPL